MTSVADQPQWVTEALMGTTEGNRNDLLASLAGFFHSKRLGEDITVQILTAYAANCTPRIIDARTYCNSEVYLLPIPDDG